MVFNTCVLKKMRDKQFTPSQLATQVIHMSDHLTTTSGGGSSQTSGIYRYTTMDGCI